MKYIFRDIIFVLFAFILFSSCDQKSEMEKIDTTILKLKNKYAPDKRVAIFDLSSYQNGENIILTGETNIQEGLSELMKEIEKEGFTVTNEVKILPEKELGDKKYGIINLSVANIRSNPEHPAELATQALLGTIVNVLKKEKGWYLIQTPDKYISWIDDDGIYLADLDEINLWKNSEKVIITSNYSTVYSNPYSSSQIVSDLVLGDLLKMTEDLGDYVSVEFPDGRTGYVRKYNTTRFSTWTQQISPDQNSIISTAEKLMGLPYLWGGTSSKGVDCSGFTKTVYFMNGVMLPRDASQQVQVGELVDTKNGFSNLQEGDLLFFGQKKTENSKERITHVAIYLGNMKYIHAAGRVRINSLDENDDDFNKYRFDTFIRAKRILGSYSRGENLVSNNLFY